MAAKSCIVCGDTEFEVKKLFCFPSNPGRCESWMKILGFKNTQFKKHHRICDKHFSNEAYMDLRLLKLKRDAIPIAWVIPSFPVLAKEGDTMPSVIEDVFPVESSSSTLSSSVLAKEGNTIPSSNEKEFASRTSTIPSSDAQDPTPSASSSACPSTPHGRSRAKIFRNIDNFTLSNSTPRKMKLVDLIRKKEDQLRKVKALCKKRKHTINSITNLSDEGVVRNLFKDMPSVTANFMLSQIRNFKAKSANARRWTLDDKIIALSLFKRSPRCYNLLRKFAALPSKNTILKLLKMVPFKVGINESIFNQLNENLPKDIHQRCCALLFDEMDIKEGVQYDMGEDKILGFEDFGDTNYSKRLATKALVFMLVGLGKNWKQPVAYYFSHRGCNAAELKKCLLEVLSAAKHVAKADVAVTVCDMGTSNVRCIKELGATKETPFFFFENSKVHCMFDPPHLLKCTYSLFRKHNVSLPVTIGETILNKVAKFQDVIAAYEIDNRNTIVFRTLWKIKATYLKPILQYAMKVNIAAKVMSHTVAAYIFSLISAGQMNPEAIGTASFIKEVDTLFDSMNGKSDDGPFGKELKGPLSVRSPHIQYWEEESQRIKKWSFIRYTKTGTLKQSMPPSQTGWLQSIKAVQGLWEYLRELGFKSLKTRTLNQDPLENLFGQIRYGCGCNDNPTVQQFIGSLKTQLLNGLVSQSFRGRNCEKDDNELVCNLKSFLNIPPQSLERETVEEASLTNEAPQISVEVLSAEIAGEVSSGSPKILSVAYVAGAILKVVKKHICCSLCDSMLTASDLEPQNLFIMNKEWSDQRSVLLYPSESYTVSIGCGITVLEEFLDESPSHPKVKVTALAVLSTMNFDHLACSEHKSHIRDITTAALCRIGIPWWCRRKCEEVKTEAKTRSMNKKLKKILHQ